MLAFTEFDEGIAFDLDDPDFAPSAGSKIIMNSRTDCCSVEDPVSTPMSDSHYGNVVHADNVGELLLRSQSHDDGLSNLRRDRSFGSSSSISSSIDDLRHQTVLTIEELRIQLHSCFTCGVSWQDDHVSLDCSECGGYSLKRPCLRCDGRCANEWQRDLRLSHTCGKAQWIGECGMTSQAQPPPPRDLQSNVVVKNLCGANA